MSTSFGSVPVLCCLFFSFFYSFNAGVGINIRRPCGAVNALNWTEGEGGESDRHVARTLHGGFISHNVKTLRWIEDERPRPARPFSSILTERISNNNL